MSRLFGHKVHKDTEDATRLLGEITPEEVKKLLGEGKSLQIVDVREPQEYAEARVQGSILIPLGQLSARLDELRKDKPVVAMCRSGNRSRVAVEMLQRAGFREVSNLKGGVLAWTKSK